MANTKQIKSTIKNLEKLWLGNPNLRFGQLVYNILVPEDLNHLYNIEDQDSLKKIIKYGNIHR